MEEIEVILPDGGRKRLPAGASILALLQAVGLGEGHSVVAAKVDGALVDLASVPLPGSCVELVTADSPLGLQVLRHSAAHLMAAAVQALFPEAKFAIGPAIENGFYYDIQLPRSLTAEDLGAIEAKMRELAAENLPFVRFEVPIEEALALVKEQGQDFKVEILETIKAQGVNAELKDEADPRQGMVSFYRTGHFVDLCRGPHVPTTSRLQAFKLTHLAGAYWWGDERKPMLQRIYGTAFPTEEALAQHLFRLEEAKRRDHRRLGKELDLFSVQEEIGPGLILWHPKGALMRKLMEDFLREKHSRYPKPPRGYEFVFTPHVARLDLWGVSGHLDYYRENMFPSMELEGVAYQLKPMNCPFHIMIYKSHMRSYRDLPLRFAELGTVYRYERSGVLHGLLRVRGFTQDDAHLFVRPDQLEDEIHDLLVFTETILGAFGFKEYEVYLSTRPRKYAGTLKRWELAEGALRSALDRWGTPYQIDPGEGVFYGPKIDLKIKDSLGRSWQCTTIQVDFNLPERFQLAYIGEDGAPHQPIMIHRAILGSLERFFGILIEHYAGAFPTWLAPEQARVVPVALRHHEYAHKVYHHLVQAGIRAEADLRNETVGFKIRDAERNKVPYVLVVGDRELKEQTVSVRGRGGRDLGSMGLSAFLERLGPELLPPSI